MQVIDTSFLADIRCLSWSLKSFPWRKQFCRRRKTQIPSLSRSIICDMQDWHCNCSESDSGIGDAGTWCRRSRVGQGSNSWWECLPPTLKDTLCILACVPQPSRLVVRTFVFSVHGGARNYCDFYNSGVKERRTVGTLNFPISPSSCRIISNMV